MDRATQHKVLLRTAALEVAAEDLADSGGGGVAGQLIVTAGSSGNGFFTENPERTLNVFAFFTIQSNLILGATCLVLAMDPDRRRSTPFRTLRLNGVLCIAVTGIVYHVALAQLDELTGGAAVANLLVHTVTPLLGVVGWLIFGPRGQTDARIVAWSLVFPLAWLVFTLVRAMVRNAISVT